MEIGRRKWLKLAGAAGLATTLGLSGCLHDDGESGDVPAYTDWIRLSSGSVSFVRFDAQEMDRLDSDGDSDEMTEEEQQDPMISLPIYSAFALFALIKFSNYGIEGLSDGQEIEVESVSLSDVLVLDGTTVLAGDVDTDAMEETVLDSSAGGDLEATGEIGDFTIYTEPEGDVDPIAIGGDGVVLPSDEPDDPEAALRDTLETYSDGTDRAVDENEDFAWMVSEAGAGLVALGGYGTASEDDDSDSEYEALSGMEGLVVSLARDESEVHSSFAGLVGDADPEALRETLGASADDSSVDIEDDRVTATATWDQS